MTGVGHNSDVATQRIAELRRLIQSNKGKAHRAQGTIYILQSKIRDARDQMSRDRAEIISLGGKVRS